jgi:hypothetical protein
MSSVPIAKWPAVIPAHHPDGDSHSATHQTLPIHIPANTTHNAAPPHFTVFLILGCGFTA